MTYTAIKFGPFPYEVVNRTLGVELVAGNVYCSVRAQQHMERDHPTDFPIIMPRLEIIVLGPTWIGQSPRHATNIEFVKRISLSDGGEPPTLERRIALLAIDMEPDRYGDYRIVSGYIIDQEDIDSRLRAGRLFLPK